VESVKTAIVLFVKNEVHDIAAWIAWHLAIGADHLFIYDDSSSDGTDAVIERAACACDITVVQVRDGISSETAAQDRQRDAYFDACRKAAGRFDWIGLLDADDYVSLDPFTSIGAYLAQFPDANGVALNWRVHGSSGRVLRTKLPPYEAYTHHSGHDLPDNAHVRSFVRPETVAYDYIGPDRFRVEGDKYVDALGHAVIWQESRKDPEWRNAHINRYACRSMESHVDRIRCDADETIHRPGAYWDHFNRNEHHSQENGVLVARANDILQTIREACVSAYIDGFRRDESHFTATPATVRLFRVHTYNKASLVLDAPEGRVAQHWGDSVPPHEIRCAVYSDDQNVAYLFREAKGCVLNIGFHIVRDPRKAWAYRFLCSRQEGSGQVLLSSPANGLFMSCAPAIHGGSVECSRDQAREWEHFTLEPISDLAYEASTSPNRVSGIDSFLTCLSSPAFRIAYNDFMLMIANLTDRDRARLLNRDNAAVIRWII